MRPHVWVPLAAVLSGLLLLAKQEAGISFARAAGPVSVQAQIEDVSAGDQRLATAFLLAFGAPDHAIRRIGAAGEATRFVPGRLIDTRSGPVLVSEGRVLSPTHFSRGKLALFYFDGRTSRVTGAFVPAVESGSMGALTEWTVRRDLGPYPVLLVEGGGTWQGYTCSTMTLIEIGPQRPRVAGKVPLLYDDRGASGEGTNSISGRILPAPSGSGFKVVYSGSQNFVEDYRRASDAFVLASGRKSRMKSC